MTAAELAELEPGARAHGWVLVAPADVGPMVPGAGRLEAGAVRPAYVDAGGTVVYSPPGASSWRDAPPTVAASMVLQYVDRGPGSWRPWVAPAGVRVVA